MEAWHTMQKQNRSPNLATGGNHCKYFQPWFSTVSHTRICMLCLWSAVSMKVRMSLWHADVSSFRYISRNGIRGSMNQYSFYFQHVRNLSTGSPNGVAIYFPINSIQEFPFSALWADEQFLMMFQTEPNMLFPATTPPPLNRLFPPLEELNKQKVVTQKVENACDVGVSLSAQSIGLPSPWPGKICSRLLIIVLTSLLSAGKFFLPSVEWLFPLHCLALFVKVLL